MDTLMKSNLYTRTGDSGTTSLVDGSRTPKDHPRVDAYGDIDELSSALGLVASGKECPEEIRDEIRHIQNLMFSIGSYMATPSQEAVNPEKTSESETPEWIRSFLGKLGEETEKLEGWIDSLDERTPKIRSFVLPGGSDEASRCHLARTICRRAERKAIALSRESHVDPGVIAYLNRLSDYLFITARYLNFLTGIDDIAWHP